MVTGVLWVPHLSDLQLQHSLCEAELLVRLDVLAALLPQRHCVLLNVAHLQEHTAWGGMIWGGSYDVNTDLGEPITTNLNLSKGPYCITRCEVV